MYKKNKIYNLFFLLIIVVTTLMVSCSNVKDLEEYSPELEKLLITNEGVLRGVEIGMNLETVKKIEKAALSDESNDYLYYDATLNESDYFTINYYFSEKGLYEITMDVYQDNTANALSLKNALETYLNDKYGKSKIKDDYMIWETDAKGFKNVEISLFGEEREEGGGYVSLSVIAYE
ncbi:MAG: hypothetical protein ACK4IK_00985 [Bacteroidia bacterium]